MNTDDGPNWHPNAHGPSEGAPTNAELGERMARVEEKLDHQAVTLERIADRLDEDLTDTQETVAEMEDQHQHLWFVYRGAKWAVVVGSGSSVLAAILSIAIGLL